MLLHTKCIYSVQNNVVWVGAVFHAWPVQHYWNTPHMQHLRKLGSYVHALESGNCTSRGIGTDVTCQMVIRRFDPIICNKII